VTAGETTDEKNLYRLIWLRAVASQMADAVYEDTRITLESDARLPVEGRPKALFKASGRVLTPEKGWRGVMEEDDWKEGKEGGSEEKAALPMVKEGDVFPCSAAVLEKKTRPPPRYTEASLVNRLESSEIGRPSTYAAIMGGIKRREYVRVEKKMLHATARGEEVVGMLSKAGFSFVSDGYTKAMEGDLDAIHEGGKTYEQVVAAADAVLDRELGLLPESSRAGRFGCSGGEPAGQCQCGGTVRETAKAWQCDAPTCQAIVWKESFGRNIARPRRWHCWKARPSSWTSWCPSLAAKYIQPMHGWRKARLS
jgi:DNA topoisomerase-1